jgi:hypothetical protein
LIGEDLTLPILDTKPQESNDTQKLVIKTVIRSDSNNTTSDFDNPDSPRRRKQLIERSYCLDKTSLVNTVPYSTKSTQVSNDKTFCSVVTTVELLPPIPHTIEAFDITNEEIERDLFFKEFENINSVTEMSSNKKIPKSNLNFCF